MSYSRFVVMACAFVGAQAGVWGQPDSPSGRAKAPAVKWRVVKAQTYTFRDEWKEGRTMRAVRIWIDSPGYMPTIFEVIPDDTDLPAHWQLTDEQGNAYVKESDGLEILDYEKRKSRNIHCLEFTAYYIPIPNAKVGHIRLRFPLELSPLGTETGGKDVVVQVDAPVTHHK